VSQPVPPDKYGVASVLLGVVALITCWLVIGIFFGVAAVITGSVARTHAKRGEAGKSVSASAGIVLGVASIVAGLIAIATLKLR
jgi:ABC-type phosphate transport system permease subunit